MKNGAKLGKKISGSSVKFYDRSGYPELAGKEDEITDIVGVEKGNVLLYNSGMSAVHDVLNRHLTKGEILLYSPYVYSSLREIIETDLKKIDIRCITPNNYLMKKVFNKNWKKYTSVWLKVTPPWRPSAFELKKYSQFLQDEFGNKKNKQALILGSTPEFRDLLHKHQFQVTCLDINREMFQAMETVMKTEPTKERLKIGNWLDRPFKKNYFDVVVSDEALDNIAYKDYLPFHKNVSDYLKEGGYYLYGCYYLVKKSFLPPEIRSGKFKALIEFYQKNPGWFKRFSNKEIIYQAFINQKNKAYFDQKNWQIKFGWYEQSLLDLWKRKKIDRAAYCTLSFSLGLDSKFTQLYKKGYERIFERFFKIIKVYQDPGYHFHNKSLYIMKKK